MVHNGPHGLRLVLILACTQGSESSEKDMANDVQDIEPGPLPRPGAIAARLVALLDPAVLLPSGPGARAHVRCRGLAHSKTRRHIQPVVGHALPACPHEGKQPGGASGVAVRGIA